MNIIKVENKSKFVNFWEFLNLPMNSPIEMIKTAFYFKFEEIEVSLDKGDTKYTPDDLKMAINAFKTLSDPYKRYLHNCEIDGEQPDPTSFDDGHLFDDRNTSNEDLSEDGNREFIDWLLRKAEEYMNIYRNRNSSNAVHSNIIWPAEILLFSELANMLYNSYIAEQKKVENEKNSRKKNIYK